MEPPTTSIPRWSPRCAGSSKGAAWPGPDRYAPSVPEFLRPSAKAVVVRDAPLLVTRNQSSERSRWRVADTSRRGPAPWGGPPLGVAERGVRRDRPDGGIGEALVDTGVQPRDTTSSPGWVSRITPSSSCSKPPSSTTGVRLQKRTDHQVGWDWVPVADLAASKALPEGLIVPLIIALCDGGETGPVYLGDVN